MKAYLVVAQYKHEQYGWIFEILGAYSSYEKREQNMQNLRTNHNSNNPLTLMDIDIN